MATYTKISLEMVNPGDIAENAKEEEEKLKEENFGSSCFNQCVLHGKSSKLCANFLIQILLI